jgi:hypothetical protein
LRRTLVGVAMVWLAAGLAPAAQSAKGDVVPGAQLPPGGMWRDAPGYLHLFAPSGPRAGAYHFFVSPVPVETVIAGLASDPSLLRPPGAWSPVPVLPMDAFGQTGGYDRSKLARLYSARRPLVARGPRGNGGRPIEAWTLISPYPSRDLARLEPGTMLIVLDLQ